MVNFGGSYRLNGLAATWAARAAKGRRRAACIVVRCRVGCDVEVMETMVLIGERSSYMGVVRKACWMIPEKGCDSKRPSLHLAEGSSGLDHRLGALVVSCA